MDMVVRGTHYIIPVGPGNLVTEPGECQVRNPGLRPYVDIDRAYHPDILPCLSCQPSEEEQECMAGFKFGIFGKIRNGIYNSILRSRIVVELLDVTFWHLEVLDEEVC